MVIYRSPNLPVETYQGRIDVHVCVRTRQRRAGRPIVGFYFRMRDPTPRKWQPLCQWPGKKPKSLWRVFQPYRRSIAVAVANGR